jgi:hypothetical protein
MFEPIEDSAIAQYICERYSGVVPINAWGETSFFYNPKLALPRGVYFATLKSKDGANDKASNLTRPSVYRLNIGVSKAIYSSLFGAPPARPAAGGVVDTGHDFSALNTLLPHPVYGWMAWVSVLNPSPATFDSVKPLLDEAHRLAVLKFRKRVPAA